MKNLEILAGIVEYNSYVGYDYHDGQCRQGSSSNYTLILDDGNIIEWKSDKNHISPQEIIDHVLPIFNKEENPLDWQWTKGWINLVSETSKERSGRYGWSKSETMTFEVFVS